MIDFFHKICYYTYMYYVRISAASLLREVQSKGIRYVF